MDTFQHARTTLKTLTQQLENIEEQVNQAHQQLLNLERSAALNTVKTETFKSFMQKPYLIRPIKGDEFELIIPKFIDFRAGWPVQTDGEYMIFRVSRFIDLLSPLPDWLRQELNYEDPEFQAHLDGDRLVVNEGDPALVWQRLGGRERFSSRIGNELRVRFKSRFDLIRDLVRQGILPYTPQAIPANLLREPLTNVTLRPEQQRDFEAFLKWGAVSCFATGGAGKTFFGIYALASIIGPKVVFAPRRTIIDQWRARVEAHCDPTVLQETRFLTYQSVRRSGLNGEFSLAVYDEIQHLPADMGIAAAEVKTQSRIGLSATPFREDGQEDLIPALCGHPVGFDWPSGEPPKTTVWVVDQTDDKIDLVKSLLEKPVAGKSIIFVYQLKVGQRYAKLLDVPFVSGQTPDQLKVINEADTVVLSKVGDAGISVNAVRVVEVDFLGGRTELAQRWMRLQHYADEQGEFHVILTWDEFHRHNKRLSALYTLGFDVRVAGSDFQPTPNRQYKHKPNSQRSKDKTRTPDKHTQKKSLATDKIDLPPALANKIAAAKSAVDRPRYVDIIFNACSQAPLSSQEIAEGIGSTSSSTVQRINAAVKALVEQGILQKISNNRYEVDRQEIDRLKALANLAEGW